MGSLLLVLNLNFTQQVGSKVRPLTTEHYHQMYLAHQTQNLGMYYSEILMIKAYGKMFY